MKLVPIRGRPRKLVQLVSGIVNAAKMHVRGRVRVFETQKGGKRVYAIVVYVPVSETAELEPTREKDLRR